MTFVTLFFCYSDDIFIFLRMVNKKMSIKAVWEFYRDGFRQMTWGRPLWALIILKVIILFLVLRMFFFKPAMAGMTDQQRSEQVGTHLIESVEQNNSNYINEQ